MRTEKAVERADVCVVVVDAARGVQLQDLKIAEKAWEEGAGLILAVNKWDLIEEKDSNTATAGRDELIKRVPFFQWVPTIYISALTGQRARKVLDKILEVAEQRDRRLQTSEVNRVVQALVERNQPPQKPGAHAKIFYASQVDTRPPGIAVITNRPDAIPESYIRYLHNGFRKAWEFEGSPLRVKLKRKRSKGRGAR